VPVFRQRRPWFQAAGRGLTLVNLPGMKRAAGFLILQYRATRLTVDPTRGGAIREFTWRGQDFLRPTPADAGDDPFEMACFPMVPFVNRVARGRFTFGGRAVQLERNWSDDPHPLHGQGWRSPWSVVAASKSGATLRFEGGGNEWPWRYCAQPGFQLVEDGLLVELSVENLSAAPMPVMLGLHPYFPDAAYAQLEATLPRVWLTDAEVLPLSEAQTPPEWRFEPVRAVHAVALDHSFAGWDGIASLSWPDRTCMVRATRCSFLHVYTPAGRGFFCLEPHSAAPGALDRDAAEATVVPPGVRFAIRVHFTVGAS
jgi:aldose 1-epimerase